MKDSEKQNKVARRVVVLGSTGSVGRQTMDVIRMHHIPVSGLCAMSDVQTLEEQIRAFSPPFCAMYHEAAARDLRVRIADTNTKVLQGSEGVCQLAALPDADLVFNSILGTAGLRPTLAAIEAGKDIALSNKETLVTAGTIVMQQARRKGVKILPVDSEHCAIWQCLNGENHARIKRLWLTCSGGAFRGYSKEQLDHVTLEQTLAHPTWQMGAKITVDCATLMNKGLELIEAVHLFGVSANMVEIVLHPQSIIHSMVEYIDNAVLAQMSVPDMRLCIQYALTAPDRLHAPTTPLDFFTCGALTFDRPDYDVFPLPLLARHAIERGGNCPAVLNGANEAAVQAFLQGKISFAALPQIVTKVCQDFPMIDAPDLEQIEQSDKLARQEVVRLLETGVF